MSDKRKDSVNVLDTPQSGPLKAGLQTQTLLTHCPFSGALQFEGQSAKAAAKSANKARQKIAFMTRRGKANNSRLQLL